MRPDYGALTKLLDSECCAACMRGSIGYLVKRTVLRCPCQASFLSRGTSCLRIEAPSGVPPFRGVTADQGPLKGKCLFRVSSSPFALRTLENSDASHASREYRSTRGGLPTGSRVRRPGARTHHPSFTPCQPLPAWG